MHFTKSLIKKAVPVILAGMAFLFFSCGTTGNKGILPVKTVKSSAGYSNALADYEAGRYKSALEAFTKILKNRPDHPDARIIRYYRIFSLYHTGDHKGTVTLAAEWLKDYPESPERYKMQRLAGDANRAMGLMHEACFWVTVSMKTARASGVTGDYEAETAKAVNDIISMSSEADLNRIKRLDGISQFMPAINLRQAEIALARNAFVQAKRLATLAVNSASEQNDEGVALKGRALLSQITEAKEENIMVTRKVIGCLLPLKGDYALYGEEILKGLQLGLDLFGEGEAGVSIELVIRNTNASPEDTVNAITELIQKESVIAIIGPLSQSASAAAAKKAQEDGVPIITFTQKPDITKVGEWVFRNYLTPDKEVEALVTKAIGDMGMLRFGIFYPDSSYGRHLMQTFWDRVDEMGGEITAVESYKADDTDFADGIKKMAGLYYPRPRSVFERLKTQRLIKLGFADAENSGAPLPGQEGADQAVQGEPLEATAEDSLEAVEDEVQGEEESFPDEIPDRSMPDSRRPGVMDPDAEGPDMVDIEYHAETDPIVDFDAVFIPDNSQNIALIAPQFPFYNVFNVPFLGTSLWPSGDLLKTTSEYLQGAVFPTGFYADNESASIMDFVTQYREIYGKEPGLLAATGFDTIKMIQGLFIENDINTRADFQQALLEYKNYSGVTGAISFDEEGEVEKMPTLLIIHGKSYHILR
ncbi:MAG: penicillin-binding protein activator [Deltaproteobacteria bacterium]|nr:penicillin-binding protein activator [Deltaproteobacteria bacterium]